MDLELFTVAVVAMMALLVVVLLYGARTLWKTNNKGGALCCVCIAVITAIGVYAIYGDRIAQWLK